MGISFADRGEYTVTRLDLIHSSGDPQVSLLVEVFDSLNSVVRRLPAGCQRSADRVTGTLTRFHFVMGPSGESSPGGEKYVSLKILPHGPH